MTKEDIKKVLETYDMFFSLNDGGYALDESDFEHAAEVIYNELKNKKKQKTVEKSDKLKEDGRCKNYRDVQNGWSCSIYACSCDGISCQKTCEWFNETGNFAYKKKN